MRIYPALRIGPAERRAEQWSSGVSPSLTVMRAVQMTRFGGLEVMDVVDLPDPVPGDGEQLFDISSSEVDFRDTHPTVSAN